MKWLVADSLYCPEQFFASHLDSYSHYLREAGEEADSYCLNFPIGLGISDAYRLAKYDVLFALDQYDRCAKWPLKSKRVAQVAAICNPMPWDVRRPDGSPAYDLVLSSIPSLVEQGRAAGARCEYMPLAFDTRARACGMGAKRDLDCIFIGTVGPDHKRRGELLRELADIVTVLPPVFGREYFRTLARAKVLFCPHAEWARGAANAMKIFEGGGMACQVIADGEWPPAPSFPIFSRFETAEQARYWIQGHVRHYNGGAGAAIREHHTYECRVPDLISLVRSL